MIETITLKNFQSHKNSILELCPGVNVIVGNSDAGKSAIIRALYWLAFGKPAGTSIMRHNVVKPTMIEVTTQDGVLQKWRNEKIGYYVLNGETYKGFGSAIPKPIFDFLNLGEINFMRQLDPLFLLSKSGGELAQYLNKLINLEIIDTSLTNIKQTANAEQRQITACEENIARLEKQLREFDFIPEFEEKVIQLEKLENKLAKLQKMKSQITGQLEVIKQKQNDLASLQWVKGIGKHLETLEAHADKINDIRNRIILVRNALCRIEKAKATFDTLKHVKPLEGAILSLYELVGKTDKLNRRKKVLQNAVIHYRNAIQQHNTASADLDKAQAEFEQNKPKTCPTCGQPWR